MEWYELNEDEKKETVFSNFSLKDFWNWWSDKKTLDMEIRIKNYKLCKNISERLLIPFTSSGVIVNSYEKLKKVIAICLKNKTVVWFGINPRKKNYNRYGYKTFGCGKKGGCADINVDTVNFLFLDIDRKNKEDNLATQKDLNDCNYLADRIIEQFGRVGFANNYIKIASGNGLQLLIKIDFPIKLPDVQIKNDDGMYLVQTTNQFNIIKNSLMNGIGNEITKFSRKIAREKELNAEIDKTCFTLSRVGALPFTKNFKFDSFRYRGILELKNKLDNTGLVDYILSYNYNYSSFKNNNFLKINKPAPNKYIIKQGELEKNQIVRFMLDNKLPYGEINNVVWFQLKCLLRDSKFNLNSDEFRRIHRKLESKYNGQLTTNLPGEEYQFNLNAINNYCIKNGFNPIYTILENKNIKMTNDLDIFDFSIDDNLNIIKYHINNEKEKILFEGEHEISALKRFKIKYIKYNGDDFVNTIKFLKGCYIEFGEEKTDNFLLKTNLLYRELSFK